MNNVYLRAMRIQYMSDLHMELYENLRYIKANEFEVVGDVLVLAGDTFYLRDTIAPQKRFWNWASKNFRQVLLVPGVGNGCFVRMSVTIIIR